MPTQENIFMQFATLVNAQSIYGKDYTDSRSDYVGKSGFLNVEAEEDGGCHMIYYILDKHKSIAKIEARHGQFVEENSMIMIRTARSVYAFKKSYELSQEDEEILFDSIREKFVKDNEY